jgi:hypothetical protein
MTKVRAKTGGWQILEPPTKNPNTGMEVDGKRMRIAAGEVVDWLWPILPPSHPDYDPDHRLPKGWEVVSDDTPSLAEELERRANPDKDPYRERLREQQKPEPEPPPVSRDRADLIVAAVAGLEVGNQEHYAGRGPRAKPRVTAVQDSIMQMVEEETGVREHPEWVTRKSIDKAVHEAGMDSAE